MKKYVSYISLLIIVSIAFIESCKKPEDLKETDYNEWLSCGAQTVFDAGSGAYSNSFPNLSDRDKFNHEVGDNVFSSTFVSAPAPNHPGLGPIFNGVSCGSCHVSDGRGHPPAPGEQMVSMLFRISVSGTDEHGGPMPVPGFGGQLQQRAVVGSQPEASVDISYTYQTYSFPDGVTYELRAPTYTLLSPYTGVPADMMMSPRIAPPVYGVGLLEAIPESEIVSREDVNDADGDGISGKANYVWDVVHNKMALGRFGWKAGTPSLLQQSALAFNQDIGVTNSLYKNESSLGQSQYDGLSDDPEISDSLVDAVAFYTRTLAVPARRNVDDAQVKRGKYIFEQAGCIKCHVPMSKTEVNVAFPAISNQTIFPYTDLLLHDMGEGLSDDRPDNLASGREWRTRSLWGIGLTQKVSGQTNFLHDGRARSFLEAVMWHGGEATHAQQYVYNLSTDDRNALVQFLESL